MPREKLEIPVNKLKILLRSLLDHYPVLAALFTVVFMVICLIFGEVFLASFSIDYFSFGGITDVYQIPLSNGILSSLFMTSTVVATFISIAFSAVHIYLREKNTTVETSDDLSLKDRIKYLGVYVLIPMLMVFLCVYLITIMLIDTPARKAEVIKNGFSERYNVHTKDEEYLCYSIIGGTSQYLFLWNYNDKHPLIVARSNIKALEQIIPSSPLSWDIKRNNVGTDEEIETRKNNLKSKQEAWSHLLSSKCSQVVIWKDVRYKQLLD
jgi:hypothetical protein